MEEGEVVARVVVEKEEVVVVLQVAEEEVVEREGVMGNLE
jgi:hypothetical protein|tara:strand:+ start:3595 stop:3714 length:120 start_codon:yes stop_codon:yes gene_type:complete